MGSLLVILRGPPSFHDPHAVGGTSKHPPGGPSCPIPLVRCDSERLPHGHQSRKLKKLAQSHMASELGQALTPGCPLPMAISYLTLVFTCSLSSYNRTREKRCSFFMNPPSVGAPQVLTYPGHPPHRGCDPAIQPCGPPAFLLFCFYPPRLPPYHPSSPSLQQSSFNHRDRLALSQALGIPSSCSFTGSIPEGSTSPLPPSRPRTACLCLPWCQWKLVELRPYPTNFLHQVQSLL